MCIDQNIKPIFIILSRILLVFLLVSFAVKAETKVVFIIALVYSFITIFCIWLYCKPLSNKKLWLIRSLIAGDIICSILYILKLYQSVVFIAVLFVILWGTLYIGKEENKIKEAEEDFINSLISFKKIKEYNHNKATLLNRICPKKEFLITSIIIISFIILLFVLPNIIDEFYIPDHRPIKDHFDSHHDFSDKFELGCKLFVVSFLMSIIITFIESVYDNNKKNYYIYMNIYKWMIVLVIFIICYVTAKYG